MVLKKAASFRAAGVLSHIIKRNMYFKFLLWDCWIRGLWTSSYVEMNSRRQK